MLVLDSAVKHSLADGAYGQRRKQCEEASSIMGVPSLREATLFMLVLRVFTEDFNPFTRRDHGQGG